MKITHYLKGDVTPKKRGSNQYVTKQKTMSKGKAWGIVVLAFFAIGAIITGYRAYEADASIFTKVFMGKDVVEVKVQSELTEEQQAKLKKEYELSIKETALMNKKAKLDTEYKTNAAQLESELEAVRSEKISFQ